MYFLAMWLGVGMQGALSQQPAAPSLFKITSPKPNSQHKLKVGEFLAIEIRFKNNTKNTVLFSGYASNSKRGDVSDGYRPASLEPNELGTVTVEVASRAPNVADQIKIRATDKVTRQEIAVVTLPVEVTWGDAKAAPAPNPAAGAAAKPAPATAPAQAPRPAPGQPGMLRFELQGYEVSHDVAARLFIAQADEFDPKALLTSTAALVGARKATLVKLPFTESFSGARATAVPAGGYSLESHITLGRDRRTTEIVYALRRISDQSGTVCSVPSTLGGITFLGSLPGSSADTLVLAFFRITQL